MIDTRGVVTEDEAALTQWFSHDLMIGGRTLEASSGERFDVINPATGETITSVASASVQDALDAVAAAETALPGWAATPPRERAEILRRAFDVLTARGEDLARLIVIENGKSLADARGEMAYATEFFRWYSEEAVRILGSVQQAPAGKNRILV
ncbi:MAG: aldehyde dehydrogenase family protein, partial [Terrimesophilobacter sp.]